MTNEYFQYDSCVSKGICSINPRTSALQGVLLIYLKLISKYALNLFEKGIVDKISEELILNTINIAVSNPEFTESSFISVVDLFKEELPKIIEKYNEVFKEEDFTENDLDSLELFKETKDIIPAIRYGEKEFLYTFENTPADIRDLYKIMLVVAKSISTNLLDLESFEKKHDDGFLTILKLLDTISIEEKDKEILKTKICEAAKVDNEIMKLVRTAQEERYGVQGISDVSYSTTPSKAVLTAGSNIRELETVLEALKEINIDVYTHDDMMLAHTFPKFSEYKNLKGQYGHGLENCLLDFATFPGPIILTKHSLHNIENLYRGRLFTTDYTCPKGVIRIVNNNYAEVIESAEQAKGFKTGKHCETVTIGFDYKETIDKINVKIKEGAYNKIFFIGLEKYSLEQNTYFEKLIKLAPDNVLIISFSYNLEKENLIHINTCFDSYSMIKIYDEIKDYGGDIVFFMPKCDRNTISQMIYLSEHGKTKVLAGKCTPIIINPSLIKILQEIFHIDGLTSAKKDLEKIIEDK